MRSTAKVWHSIHTRDSLFYQRGSFLFNEHGVKTAFQSNNQYKLVLETTVELDPNINISLDELYTRTNNLSKPWNGKDRSTAVGDIIQIGERTFVVAPIGFDEITDLLKS